MGPLAVPASLARSLHRAGLRILRPSAALCDVNAVKHVLTLGAVCTAWRKAAESEVVWKCKLGA